MRQDRTMSKTFPEYYLAGMQVAEGSEAKYIILNIKASFFLHDTFDHSKIYSFVAFHPNEVERIS